MRRNIVTGAILAGVLMMLSILVMAATTNQDVPVSVTVTNPCNETPFWSVEWRIFPRT